MKRLSKKEEKEIFSDEMEKENINTVMKMLPLFGYNNDSTRKVKEAIKGEFDFKNRWTMKFFDLNGNQNRAIYEIPDNKEEDTSYLTYKDILINNLFKLEKEKGKNFEKLKNIIVDKNLLDYGVYVQGKFRINKQDMKLFKFLLKNKLMTTEESKKITTGRKKSELRLVISKNIVDYIMCSTNQNFKSCLSLSSTHEGAYWLGLPAAILDPNRILAFTTKGGVADYSIPQNVGDLKHFRIVNRAWCILLKNDSVLTVSEYPNKSNNIKNVLVMKYKTDIDRKHQVSKFSFPLLRYKNGAAAAIYHDNWGIRAVNSSSKYSSPSDDPEASWVHCPDGSTGCVSNIRFGGSFADIVDGDSLVRHVECRECGDRLQETEGVRDPKNRHWYCQKCFSHSFIECSNCDTLVKKDMGGYTKSGKALCTICASKLYVPCQSCKKLYERTEIEKLDYENGPVCKECLKNKYFTCINCGETLPNSFKIEKGINKCEIC